MFSESVLLLVSLLLLHPIAFNLGYSGDKPIDAVLSDLLIPMSVLIIALLPSKQKRHPNILNKATNINDWVLLTSGYMLLLAVVAVIANDDNGRGLTAFKLMKPLLFVLVGSAVARRLDRVKLFDRIAQTQLLYIAWLMISTILTPGFPFGYWGKYLLPFESELYAYPNMSQTFLACTIPMLLAYADSNTFSKPLYYFAAFIAFLLIVGSMSRSSTFVAVISSAIYIGMSHKKIYLFFIVTTTLVVLGGAAYLAKDTDVYRSIQDKIEVRAANTFENGDTLSGRDQIWMETVKLVSKKPIFGYSYEPYSNYSFFGTPHQQYLEVLYKTGIVGVFLYIAVLTKLFMGCYFVFYFQCESRSDKLHASACIACLVGCCIGCLTQPNLTYSLTGHFVFFITSFCIMSHLSIQSHSYCHPASVGNYNSAKTC
ncbi:O-antigen ligase family protein [Rubinisphaera italica]|uniref:O-Antigen ligase n=1 Tax=Rubinisphaera italica TaxID=2527969 RepID=A0A5C5X9I8_9PLAN|nr:O-antigen ligase family protein [Rubinisphaera italica]TWT59610.1 O-Antigen ligase [Rubinisphaera italica]